MASLPDRILSPEQVQKIVEKSLETVAKISGDNSLKNSSPQFLGIGLLVLLEVKNFERILALALSPLILGNKIVAEAFTLVRPLRFIREKLGQIREIVDNPIQFVLDEGINDNLKDFPFPVYLWWKKAGSPNIELLNSLIEENTSSLVLEESEFNYTLITGEPGDPAPGFITSTDLNPTDLTSIKISSFSNNPGEDPPLVFLQPGDIISINTAGFQTAYSVSSIEEKTGYSLLLIQGASSNSQELPASERTVYAPDSQSSSVRINRGISFRRFLTPEGTIIIPFSELGVFFPIVKDISLEIGNFDNLSPDNPSRLLINFFETRSGLDFNKVLLDMSKGIYPEIDYAALQGGDEIEFYKQQLVSLVKLVDLGIQNPFFLVKIILNYFLLLSLPFQVLIKGMQLIGPKILNPVSLIKFVFENLSNPSQFFCKILGESFIEFLEPLIQPQIPADIGWENLVQDPNNPKKGLLPLFTDLACGDYSKKLARYKPNSDFFAQQEALPTLPEADPGVQLDYIRTDQFIPSAGEISFGSSPLSEITTLRVSTSTSNVDSSSAYLLSLNPGDSFYLSIQEEFQYYKLQSRSLVSQGETSFFELVVTPIPDSVVLEERLESFIRPVTPAGLRPQFQASLNISNPDVEFLFLIENYLPPRSIFIWDQIKGIVSLSIGLATAVPTLIPTLLTGLIKSEGSEQTSNPSNVSSSLVASLVNTNRLNDRGDYETEEDRDAAREFLYELVIQNGPEVGGFIQTYFSDLQQTRKEEGLTTVVYKSELPLSEANKLLKSTYSLTQLGEHIEVMTRLLYELSPYNNPSELIPKNTPLPTVYAVSEEGLRFVLAEGSIWRAFERWNLLTAGVPDQTDNRVQVGGFREAILNNLKFINEILLPKIFEV
jgi:hypothetical protein